MARKPPPLSSFSPELQKALRAGAERETKITFTSEKLAISFVHRLNMLRKTLRVTDHPDTDQLYRCGIHRTEATVILRPRDTEFADALASLGDTIIATGVPVPEAETPSALESFLAEVDKKPTEGGEKC